MKVGVAISTALLSVVLGVSTSPAATSNDAAARADAERFRIAFGLLATEAVISESFDNAARYSNVDFNVPLTPSEAAEIYRRQENKEASTQAIEWAMSDPDFAGAWTDQRSGGTLVLMFVSDDLSEKTEKASTLLAADVPMRIERAEHRRTDLLAMQRMIDEQRENLRMDGIDIVETAIDTSRNAVLVGIVDLTDSADKLIRDRFWAGGIHEA